MKFLLVCVGRTNYRFQILFSAKLSAKTIEVKNDNFLLLNQPEKGEVCRLHFVSHTCTLLGNCVFQFCYIHKIMIV